MEQIGTILKERVEELQKLQQNVSLSQKDPAYMKDYLRELLKAKKQEKIRAAKEQNVLEIIFSSRSLNKQQRMQNIQMLRIVKLNIFVVKTSRVFEKASYDVMKYIYPNLQIRTVFSGKLPQILELFTQFFVAVDMKQKANEIFKIFSNNLCNKFSFVCLLLNILIDTVKKKLSNFIKIEAEEVTKQLGRIQISPKKESNLLNPSLIAPPLPYQNTQRQLQKQQTRINNENQTDGKSSTVLINLNECTIPNKNPNSILIQNSNQILQQDDTVKQTIKSDSNSKSAANNQTNSFYNFIFDNIEKSSVCEPKVPSSPTKIKDLLKKQEDFRQFLGENVTKEQCQSNLSSQRNNLIQLQKPIPTNNTAIVHPLSPNKKYTQLMLQRPQNHFNKQRGASQIPNSYQQSYQNCQGQGNTYSTSSTSTSVPKRHTSLKQPPNQGQIQQLENFVQQIQQPINNENYSQSNLSNQQNNNNLSFSQNNNNQSFNQNSSSYQNNNISILNNSTIKQVPDRLQKDQLKVNWNDIYNLLNQQGGSQQFNVKYQNSQYNQTTRDFFGMFFTRFMEIYKTSCTVIYELDVYYPYQMKTQLKKQNTNPKEWASMNLNNILMCMLIKNSHVKQSITQYNEQFNQYKKKKKNTSRNSSKNNYSQMNKSTNNNTQAILNNKIQISNIYPKTQNQITQQDQAQIEPNYAKPLKRYSFLKQQANTQRPIESVCQNSTSNQKAISCNTMHNLKQTTQTMATQQSQLNEDIDIPFYCQNNITKLPSLNIQNQSSDQQRQQQKQQTQNLGSEKERSSSLNKNQQEKNLSNYAFEDAAILKQQNNTYLIGGSSVRTRQKNHQRSISEFRKKLNILNNSDINRNNENQPYSNNTADINYKIIKINQKKNIQYQPESFVNALNSYSNQDILLQKKDFTPSKINRRFNLSSLPDKPESQCSNETSQKDFKDQTDYIQKIKELQKNIQICSINLGSEQKKLNEAGYLLNLPSYRQKHNKSEMNTPIKQRISQTNRPREYSCNSNYNNISNQNNNSNLNISSNNCFNIQVLNNNENNCSQSQLNKSALNFSNKKFNSQNVINNTYARQLSRLIHKSYDYPVNIIEDQKMRHQQLTESILQESYPLLHINNSKKILQSNEFSQSQIIQNSHLYPSISKLTSKIQD
ncbi:hypothetical protein ABPG74_002094 [Tetrahymena malaccensis]